MAAAIGATALVLPKIMPDLSPPMRSAIRSGLSLFVESESEAEGGIINRLADNALKNVLKRLSGPGNTDERQKAAGSVIENFQETARARSRRYGRDEQDRTARYDRHLAALRHAIDCERHRQTGARADALRDLSSRLKAAD
ncbi:MAG TPA: hypothetical protein VFN77_03310 [Acetobacteraceae bacterium]|nr:hypothetical protein [Acetobacteraceae bacterium]